MRFHIITLFPDLITDYVSKSILGKAQEKNVISIKIYNPRDFVDNKDKKGRSFGFWNILKGNNKSGCRQVDDKPYGGGPGMVIKAQPVIGAIEKALQESGDSAKIIWLSPNGKYFSNQYAKNLEENTSDIILVCGRYEGIDARVKEVFDVEEVSVGPFVLTGGELPALVMIDVISRQVSGVLGKEESVEENRIASHDVYTRPETFEYKGKDHKVPDVLLSGHHKQIEEWRKKK